MTEEIWNKHIPGDPIPCKCGESVVEVRFHAGGIDAGIAKYWNWDKPKYGPDAGITDWHFVERKGEDVIAAAVPQVLEMPSVGPDDEAAALRSAAYRANVADILGETLEKDYPE